MSKYDFTKACTNFNQVIGRMEEHGFTFVFDATINKKTCLWFEGDRYSIFNMQFIIGRNYHVKKIGMRRGMDILRVTRV